MATMVKFVDSTSAGLSINPDKFRGAAISAAASAGTVAVTLDFEKTNGAATGTSLVTLLVTANALGGHPRHGSVVEIADDVDGKYIHPDITAVSAVTL